MARINLGKVVVGGLLAGLAFNIGDFLINGVLMAADYAAAMTRLGLDPGAMTAPTVAASWIFIDLLFGILVVWNYASIRPRFGPGPKTALIAGFALFGAVTLILFGFTSMGLFTFPLFLKGSVYSAVNTAVGSVAGAWAYKEA